MKPFIEDAVFGNFTNIFTGEIFEDCEPTGRYDRKYCREYLGLKSKEAFEEHVKQMQKMKERFAKNRRKQEKRAGRIG